MMKISVNNETMTVKEKTRLNELIQQLSYETGRFAIAINGTFVPRHQYAQTQLHDDDHVDIVTAVQGG